MNGHKSILHLDLLTWLAGGVFRLGFCLALPVAVFTCNGWLGLAAHCIALSGAVSLIERSISKSTPVLPGIEPHEGDASCAPATGETM